MFHADLHIHSRFSRACSKDCDIEHLAWWALRKGISVVGTGDFTHPAWAAELRESLIPAEPGLLRLRPDLEAGLRRSSPRSCAGDVRFLLSAEISTIYRGGDRTRKVHHLIYAPGFDAADRITRALAKIGNLASDGRPILGLDSRNLLEITLAGGPGCYLVPAHAWTPWFAVLGSKSGFDLVADCYQDLAGEVFAIETGLSSDPPMNWMVSALDGYRLLSNSDAHSPPMLGREATTLSCDLDYFEMARAFRTGDGLAGTIEFFPEEGKYHLDGHRKCGVRLDPGETRRHEGTCPRCGRPLTIGVAYRVAELADRPAGFRPPGAPAFTNLIQLRQVVGELLGAGPVTKKVTAEVDRLVAALGPELGILRDVSLADAGRIGGGALAEALARLRRGAVIREAGFDGEYGTVALFEPGELSTGPVLFDLPRRATPAARPGRPGQAAPAAPTDRAVTERPGLAEPAGAEPDGGDRLGGLDDEQRAAAQAASPLLIVAGPGTGKTRTLTRRIAWQVSEGTPAGQCLAVTFTRRAAQEMRARLAILDAGLDAVTVTTFHGLGLRILRELHDQAGLPADFEVADDDAVAAVARELGLPGRPDPGGRTRLRAALTARGLVDYDGLIELAAGVLRDVPAAAAALRERWPVISVDEYQDIDAAQYGLLALLAGDGAGLTVIGDPDQAIYGFRGADVGFFLRFAADYPAARTLALSQNYRSAGPVVTAAMAAIAPATLVPGRVLRAVPAAACPPAAPHAPVVTHAPVVAHAAADEQAEAGWISAAIDGLLGGTSFHSLDSGRAGPEGQAGLSLAGIAVLYRTDAQAAALGQALTRSGLAFRKGSHDLLLRRPGVAEILAELRHPAAGAPGPEAGGSDKGAPEAGGPQAGDVAGAVAAATARLAAGLSRSRAVDILAAGDVLAPLARRCSGDHERFRAEVALGAEVDALDPRADAVTLLTIHAAKGLEWDVVFVAGCETGLLPLQRPWAPADLAEERRLLFVAMTRARTRLFLSYAMSRTRQGMTAGSGASPFLAALEGLLEREAAAVVPRPRRPPQRQLRLL